MATCVQRGSVNVRGIAILLVYGLSRREVLQSPKETGSKRRVSASDGDRRPKAKLPRTGQSVKQMAG
ncbi:MAG: hypothetical protein WB770_04275 [Acidimicrobiales bacterium]